MAEVYTVKTLIVLSFLFSFNVYAFKITPMISTIEYGQGKKSTVGMVINEGMLPVAIQLTAFDRKIDENGIETKVENLDDINIYPPQLIVPPHSKKSFKITYVGPSVGEIEKSYRVLAEESPVDLNPIKLNTSNIKFKVSYLAALYVAPKNAKSNITIKSVSKEAKRLKLVIENSGNRHQNLTRARLQLLRQEDNHALLTLETKDLAGLAGENIFPKSQRIFYVNDQGFVNKYTPAYKVNLHFDKD